MVEAITNMQLSEYVAKEFYAPLGLYQTTFNAYNSFPESQIVPSNYDYNFRKQIIKGYVHDPASAMMGGVAGHAGVFSTAREIGILYQVLLNDGYYGGVKYFDTSTVVLFTSKHGTVSRRGLGFDKAECDINKKSPCSEYASAFTFGHQGFTGTCVWADAAYGLVYVFLSNRTFPNDENSKINTMDIRGKIQDIIYKAVGADSIGYSRN